MSDADDVLDEGPTAVWTRSPPVPPTSDVLSADDVAALLRVDRKTVYEFAGRGEIPCRRLGRRILFYRPAIVAWLSHARPRRAGEEDLSDAGTS